MFFGGCKWKISKRNRVLLISIWQIWQSNSTKTSRIKWKERLVTNHGLDPFLWQSVSQSCIQQMTTACVLHDWVMREGHYINHTLLQYSTSCKILNHHFCIFPYIHLFVVVCPNISISQHGFISLFSLIKTSCSPKSRLPFGQTACKWSPQYIWWVVSRFLYYFSIGLRESL